MADLINKNNISFRCSYGGECMAEIEDCKICVHYVCDYEDIQNVDVITEQEIRNQTIDEFVANAEKWNNNIKSIRNEDGVFTIENIRKVAEQMKVGAV